MGVPPRAECPRSEASATCDGVASWRSATSSRGPPGLASLPVASGYQGMNPPLPLAALHHRLRGALREVVAVLDRRHRH